jgi:hypothetical protein
MPFLHELDCHEPSEGNASLGICFVALGVLVIAIDLRLPSTDYVVAHELRGDDEAAGLAPPDVLGRSVESVDRGGPEMAGGGLERRY